jgi:hypothetical protein
MNPHHVVGILFIIEFVGKFDLHNFYFAEAKTKNQRKMLWQPQFKKILGLKSWLLPLIKRE